MIWNVEIVWVQAPTLHLLRALLYFPAMNACRFNPDIKSQHERLLLRGKVKMQTIGAAMRKLVHICFGVLKHQVVYQSRASVI